MMNSVKKKKADKTIVREHVVQAAAKAFTRKGVKTVRMDDIAADLSISKRTLYELFHDKEDLLLDVMRLHREEMKKSMEEIASPAAPAPAAPPRLYPPRAQALKNTPR